MQHFCSNYYMKRNAKTAKTHEKNFFCGLFVDVIPQNGVLKNLYIMTYMCSFIYFKKVKRVNYDIFTFVGKTNKSTEKTTCGLFVDAGRFSRTFCTDRDFGCLYLQGY